MITASPLDPVIEQLQKEGCDIRLIHSSADAPLLCQSTSSTLLWSLSADQLKLVLDSGSISADMAARLILMLDQPVQQNLLALVDHPRLARVVIKDKYLSTDALVSLIHGLVRSDSLGISSYLKPGTQVYKQNLVNSLRRGEIVYQMERFYAEKQIDERLINQLVNIADEFITNAFYHSPVGDMGQRFFSHLSRIESVDSSPDHPIELNYASDATCAAVAVRDCYGSLDRRVLLEYLSSGFGTVKIRQGAGDSGGSGLGLLTAYRAASTLVFNIKPNAFTECIGLVEISSSYRRFVERGKLVHIHYI